MKRWVLGILLLGLPFFSGCRLPAQEPIVIVEATDPAAFSATAPADTSTSAPTPAPTPEPTPSPTEMPTEPPSEAERLWAYIDGMRVEEKIGQLCMFGFSGTKTISAEFSSIMETYRIGNVILYGQNMERGNGDGGFARCKGLTDSVRAANGSELPLLISTDVEGGSVTRFRWGKTLDSARTLGKKDDPDRAQNQFRYIGEGLLSAGINVDLAPVLDVSRSPDAHFLGKRILSSDAEKAAEIGLACIDGLHEAGVLSIVKHFPGHGAANTDSHDKTPVVQKSIDSLRSYDLVPFYAAVRGGVDGVMVAHILYEAIDADRIASQSDVIIGELLREEYGFEGIVMSDDFRMAGLRSQSALDKAAVRFILAGGDLILCGANHTYQKKILSGLYAAVEDGTISVQRLDESVFRILSAKLRATDWTI